MAAKLTRVLLGFLAANLVAGLVLVLFVVTPSDIAADSDRMPGAGLLALSAATQSAIFSAAFALLAAAFAEWQNLRGWLYYALTGVAIAAAGLMVQYSGEAPTQTILNDYAVRAFMATGILAGLTYWFIAGRRAGADRTD